MSTLVDDDDDDEDEDDEDVDECRNDSLNHWRKQTSYAAFSRGHALHSDMGNVAIGGRVFACLVIKVNV